MKIKAVSGIMLTLLLASMLTLAFNIQLVKAPETIYIRADGSVDPDTAPISSADNVTYTFTGNIYDSIVVERDNIVVDGACYTLQGTGSGTGIDLSDRNNVTVKNMEIKAFGYGIWLDYSPNNTMSRDNITNNNYGVSLKWSSNNNICHNNFMDNTEQVHIYTSGYPNSWDDGYPSGGNYWSDYTGVDSNHDGIGDTLYMIERARPYIIGEGNQDNYPLMSPWGLVEEEEEVPFWMQWWFWTIIAAGIVALAGTVYFLKKRKPSTPTASPLPPEGTL